MSFHSLARHSILFSLSGLALAACGGSTGDQEVPAPRVANFVANPMMVAVGGTTTITYQVIGAIEVKIDTGAGVSVLPSTGQLMGTVVTPTINEDTTYVLSASNGQKTTTTSIDVKIEVVNNPMPTVVSFAANPANITAGSMATLSWQTTNANQAIITDNRGGTSYQVPAAEIAAGSYQVTPGDTTTYTLTLVGEAGTATGMTTVQVTPVVTGPRVQSFTANPAAITVGQSSTLSWTVTDAAQVRITDAAGAMVYAGADLVGSQMVTPGATTQYTLVATDANNQTAMGSTTVTVNAPMAASIVSFTANPATVNLGASSTLTWNVANAPGGIEIRSGGVVLNTSAMAQGTFAVSPTAGTDYELIAISPVMNATASARVEVTVVGPAVTAFTATPNPVAVGGTAQLNWTTAGSDRVRILQGTNEIHVNTTNVASGSFTVTITAETTAFTLEASAAGMQPATRALTVYGHAAPIINSFTGTPNNITGPTQVTLAWNVENVATLQLMSGGVAVAGFPAIATTTAAVDSTGTFQVQVTQARTFTLNATSLAGNASAQVQITELTGIPEVEPNDTLTTAQPLPVGGGLVDGAINIGGDLDIYSIIVPDGGNVMARTSDGMGGCATDTVVLLADANGVVITGDDDSGVSPCSLIDPTVDPAAGDLPAGTYLIAVLHSDDVAGTGAYRLEVVVGSPMCGNGIFESGTEQCDFGDVTPGDGCSATCQLEINPTIISAPGGTVQVTLPNQNAIAVVQVNVPNPGMAITAVAADVGGTTCNAVDTSINLGDSNFDLVGSKADGGPTGTAGNCAAVLYPTDAFARDLVAGTYYLVIFNQGTTSGTVQVTVTVQNAVCGNGVFEPRAGEQCDNPNTPGSIQCSAMCQVVNNGVINLPLATPVTLNRTSPVQPGFDIFQVVVASPLRISAETFTATGVCGGGADTVVQLYSSDFALLALDDDDGVGLCSRIVTTHPMSRLQAGTYWLVVAEFGTSPTYQLQVGSAALPANPPTLEEELNDTQATATPTGLSGVGTVTMQGRTSPDGDDDVFSFVVPAGQTRTFSARTFDTYGSPTTCTANSDASDTRIFLEQRGLPSTAPGGNELAYNDDISGTSWCSAIAARPLTAGTTDTTFYVRVQGYDDAGLRNYLLNITLQ